MEPGNTVSCYRLVNAFVVRHTPTIVVVVVAFVDGQPDPQIEKILVDQMTLKLIMKWGPNFPASSFSSSFFIIDPGRLVLLNAGRDFSLFHSIKNSNDNQYV